MVSSVSPDENRDEREQDCLQETNGDPERDAHVRPESNLRIQMAREWVNLGGD